MMQRDEAIKTLEDVYLTWNEGGHLKDCGPFRADTPEAALFAAAVALMEREEQHETN